MSVEDYRQARDILEKNGAGEFLGPRSEELVARAEAALGVLFPPSYRCFVLELGCGALGGRYFYGVVDQEFERSSAPNGVWVTLSERREFGLDCRYVIFEEGGDGTCLALDFEGVGGRGEAPVVRLSVDRDVSEFVSSGFGEYFLMCVRSMFG
jgi:hypothetical protein